MAATTKDHEWRLRALQVITRYLAEEIDSEWLDYGYRPDAPLQVRWEILDSETGEVLNPPLPDDGDCLLRDAVVKVLTDGVEQRAAAALCGATKGE